MPILFKVITAVLALTGCVSLVISGEINLLMSAGGLAIIPGYYRFLRGAKPAGKWVIGTLSILTLGVFFFDAVVVSGDVFLAVAHLTIAFQAIKSFDLKEPWDHLQVYFMSLLQLVIASELTSSLVFGLVFVVFIVLLVTAMILSHFLKEGQLEKVDVRKPVYLISALTLLATALLFVAIPRTTHKFLGKGHARGMKITGFSEKVDFGAFGNVKLDPSVIMRVETDRDPGVPLYWRGIVMDYFDGSAWRHSLDSRERVARVDGGYLISSYDRKSAIEQRVYLEPIDSDVLFGLAEIKGVKLDSFPLSIDSARDIYSPGKFGRRISYTVYSVIGAGHPGGKNDRYLQLPEGMGRIADLADRITAGARTDSEKAHLIEDYLKKNYTYSLLTREPPPGVSPVEDFLFNSRRGYCEHYATSMVLMLRSLGIPARIVNGFYGGEKNEYGGYIIVRQSDAHSWVEAMTGGVWMRFDPTPAVAPVRRGALSHFLDSVRMTWARYVVGFSSRDQMTIIRALTLPLTWRGPGFSGYGPHVFPAALAAAAILLVTASLILFRRNFRIRRQGFITVRYMALRKMLKKRGFTISSSTTAADLKRQSVTLDPSQEIAEFLGLYEMHRFGGKVMDATHRKRYDALLKEIRRHLFQRNRRTW